MGAAVGAFYFAPVDTWIHDLWQVVLGWAAATTVVVAIRGLCSAITDCADGTVHAATDSTRYS